MSVATTPTKREELAVEHTWNLESMYPTEEAWEQDFESVGERLPGLAAYQGHLGESAKMLLGALKMNEAISLTVEKAYSYAYMRKDEDTTKTFYQGLYSRVMGLASQAGEAGAFIVPEILEISVEKIASFVEEEPGLKIFQFYLDEIQRNKTHTRSAEVEGVLAAVGEIGSSPSVIYDIFTDADLRFPTILGEGEQPTQLTQSNLVPLLESPERKVRQAAFEAYWDTLSQFSNTVSTTYATSVKKDIFFARARRHKSVLEESLFADNIPVAVYDNLLETVNKNLPQLHRYMHLRKKLLGVDQLEWWDVYTPLIPTARMTIPYDNAVQTVAKALQPLGDKYVSDMLQGVKSRWIDVYETEGKASGAYSYGTYLTQPFIMLNHHDTLDSMFTLAHELGHSMHSFYSNKTQPAVYAGYSLFVAEVASITNEALLNHYLLQETSDVEVRKFLINAELENIRSTLFRQTLFAAFERATHTRAEAGEALTPDMLHDLYLDLLKNYYGDAIHYDERIKHEWMRIPHFYRAFYVFQYATGISAAKALSHQIITQGEPAVKRYLNFLSSGGSDYPVNLLAKAGVDMTTAQPVQEALDQFASLLDEMERLTA